MCIMRTVGFFMVAMGLVGLLLDYESGPANFVSERAWDDFNIFLRVGGSGFIALGLLLLLVSPDSKFANWMTTGRWE